MQTDDTFGRDGFRLDSMVILIKPLSMSIPEVAFAITWKAHGDAGSDLTRVDRQSAAGSSFVWIIKIESTSDLISGRRRKENSRCALLHPGESIARVKPT